MATTRPHEKRHEEHPSFRSFVRHLLLHSVLAIPLIAALASVTLVLDTYFDAFRLFDEHVVGFAASRHANHDDVNKVFSAWVISPQLFTNAEAFKRTLPVDKEKLGKIIQQFDKARAIAVDVEAIPHDQIVKESVPREKVRSLPMFKAVERLLRAGVNVVLLSSGNRTDEVSAFYWRQALCLEAKEMPPSSGRLWWATGYLETQGPGMSVLRYFSPEQSEKRSKDGIDQGLMPLGIVLAVAANEAGRFQWLLEPKADYCSRAPTMQPPNASATGTSRMVGTGHTQKPTQYINYFRDRPAEIPIESMETLPQGGPLEVLRRGAIVLGIRTPDDFDVHGTPIAPMLGAHLHAMVAASVGKPVSQSHGWAYLIDIVVGYLFVFIFHAFQSIRVWVIEKWYENAPSAQRLVNLAFPLAAFSAICILLMLAPLAAAYGLWLNPIPMLLGLVAHLYVELIDLPKHSHFSGVRAAIQAWGRQGREVIFLTAQDDAVAWLIRQFATYGLILFAGYLLFIRDH